MTTHLAKGSKRPPAVTDKLRLYSNRFCPYSERVHLILDAKNIPYETIYINLNSIPEWLTLKHPCGKIPALELTTDDIIHDSIIIAQYIDDKYPQNRLFAKNCLERAKDMLFIDSFDDVISAMNAIMLSFGRHSIEKEHTLRKGLVKFDEELRKRGCFYGGNQPSVVDYFVWPWVERSDLIKLFRTSVVLRKEDFKNIMKWHKNMMENDVVKKHFINIEKHTKFFQTYCSGIPTYDIV